MNYNDFLSDVVIQSCLEDACDDFRRSRPPVTPIKVWKMYPTELGNQENPEFSSIRL